MHSLSTLVNKKATIRPSDVMIAIENKCLQALKLFSSTSIDLSKPEYAFGAIRHYDVIKFFIETVKVDPDVTNIHGETFLNIAAQMTCSTKTMRMLLDNGASITGKVEHPLHNAIVSRLYTNFKFLYENGARPIHNTYDLLFRNVGNEKVRMMIEYLLCRGLYPCRDQIPIINFRYTQMIQKIIKMSPPAIAVRLRSFENTKVSFTEFDIRSNEMHDIAQSLSMQDLDLAWICRPRFDRELTTTKCYVDKLMGKGWSISIHQFYPNPFRKIVRLLLLIQNRFGTIEFESPIPPMPLEMWFHVLSLCMRTYWNPCQVP
jgi:hypothetical protein